MEKTKRVKSKENNILSNSYKESLKDWETETNYLIKSFLTRYFCDAEIMLDDINYYWVANQTGSVLFVNDYFFDLQDIIDSFRYNATKKQLFDFYEYRLNFHLENKTPDINFKNFISLHK